MSNEGVALVSRVAVLLLLIVVAAFLRAAVGPGQRRGLFMVAGTVGGVSSGVAVADLISRWIGIDVSIIGACLGILAGWGARGVLRGALLERQPRPASKLRPIAASYPSCHRKRYRREGLSF